MASESASKPPSTSSPTAANSYIGSFISLISKYEIRYEGVLYHLNIQDSTIGLKGVKSYGTEGRRKDGPQVPPSDKVYEYILFRGNDIKDLQVKSPSISAKAEEHIFSDPAIIQSQYFEVPLSSPLASVGGGSSTESIQRQDTPAMISRDLPVGLPSHQSGIQLGPSDQSAATQVSGAPSFSMPMYWPNYSGISGSSSHSLLQSGPLQPHSVVSPLNIQSWMQTPDTLAPSKAGRTTLSERGDPVSSVTTSSLVNPTYEPSPTSLQTSDSLDIPSLLSSKTPMSYHASVGLSNMPSFSSPSQGINSIEDQFSGKISPDMRSFFPGQLVHRSASSPVDSTSGPLPRPPSLLTPDHFAHPRQNSYSLTQNLTPDQKHNVCLTPSSSSSFLVPSTAFQAPLLPLPPLPTSVHKPQYSASKFSEEFDFEAMNEKFKKDEVWGSLGRASKTMEGMEDNVPTDSLGDGRGLIPNPNPKPAYKKDDFFDTISCNSLSHGSRNGQNRLSERMKLDSETFGNFHQRPTVGYGAYGTGRGENYQGSHNMGRGYGYGGRGRGRNLPF